MNTTQNIAFRRQSIRLRVLLTSLFLSVSAVARATDWPTYQHDLEHTGRSTAVLDASKLMLSWTAPEGYTTPLIVGDTIYSTKSQGGFSGDRTATEKWATYISAFDLQTGAIKWTHSGNNVFPSPAAVGGEFVAFAGGTTSPGSSTPTPDADQLVVLDAATGALLYKVALPIDPGDREIRTMPLLVPNPSDGTVTAYCVGFQYLWCVSLGPTSGSLMWRQKVGASEFGGNSMPTLVGDAVVVSGAYKLFAFDRTTGTQIPINENHGGGLMTAVYDAARGQIYAAGATGLSAYRYVNNSQIEFLWHRAAGGGADGIGHSSIAIGPSGKIYVPGSGSQLFELNPETGATLRSISFDSPGITASSITKGLLWMPDGFTRVYDLDTLQLVRSLPGANSGDAYAGAGAFADDYFVNPHGWNVFSKGFDVWTRPTARLLNISTRLRSQAGGGHEMFAGFIISGSDPKQVLIRALGPTLQQFGISETLPDPTIELHDSSRVLGTNDNWKDSQASEIQATGLAPLHDSEAAMLITLNPGAYTAIVRDASGGAGVGLVEVYDQGKDDPVKLANISTRGYIESGVNVMIAGFILGNEDLPALVVVRALGPSLAKFGSADCLPDPTLELHDANGVLLQSNDNWRDSQEAEITAAGLAPENNAESAIITTLPPSAYTAVVAGKNGQTGIGVVEVYHVR